MFEHPQCISLVRTKIFLRLTFLILDVVSKYNDCKGKNTVVALSIEISQMVMMFPRMLILDSQICTKQHTLLKVSAPKYLAVSILVIPTNPAKQQQQISALHSAMHS